MADQNIKILAKFLEYVLGRHPDEFGLLLDDNGFCKIKTLLQALHEDPEWRHVRQGQLNSLLLIERPAPIEVEEDRIRARIRDQLPDIRQASELPKLLYTAVRQRAYPVVLDKGLKPGGLPYILLCGDKDKARRLGRRVDNAPVLLTVQVAAATENGVQFEQYGQHLYLTAYIPPEAVSGPPLPKEKAQTSLMVKAPPEMDRLKTPGSFFPDFSTIETPNKKRRGEKEWKKDRRQQRREKDRQKW